MTPAKTSAPGPEPGNEADRICRGAITGADAYRATRSAVRVERGIVRLGNRFVPLERYREIAFLALGRAAVSQGYALVDALGEALTQGYLAGPDPVPEAIPFTHRQVGDVPIGSPDAFAVGAAALELAQALGPRDLLIVALSPGSLALLAQAPEGMDPESYRSVLANLRTSGVRAAELESFVSTTASGPVGGRLGEAGEAEVLPLIVDRGVSPELTGGGPTLPLGATDRPAAEALLRRHWAAGPVPAPLAQALARPPALTRTAVHRPVVVASPADALQGAGDALSEAKWWSRLAALRLEGGPDEVATAFLEKLEEVLRGIPKSRELRKGVAVFAASPLECPDGEGEGEALLALLSALRRRARRREVRYVAFRTTGARTGAAGRSSGLVDPTESEIRTIASFETGRPGVTDVGPIVAALVPERAAG